MTTIKPISTPPIHALNNLTAVFRRINDGFDTRSQKPSFDVSRIPNKKDIKSWDIVICAFDWYQKQVGEVENLPDDLQKEYDRFLDLQHKQNKG